MLILSKLRGAFSFRHFLGGLGIATVGALILRALSGVPFWVCLVIAFGAMLVNGWLAEWEDNQPGGFNNPLPDDLSSPEQPDLTDVPGDKRS